MRAGLWLACDVERMDALAFRALHPLPAVLPYQRHKAHRSDLFRFELVAAAREHEKDLLVTIAQRNKDLSAFGQLLVVGRRYLGCAGADEYGIVRSVLAPTKGSIAKQEGDVARANLLDCFARFVEQGGNSFDGEDLSGELREKRRLVTRPRPYFQHFLISLQVEQLEVSRMNRWLRYRLTVADRQRRVFVGAMAYTRGHEEMTRHLVDGVEHGEVLDSLLVEQFDQTPPRPAELVLYGCCHQFSADASIAWCVRSRCNGVTDMYPSCMARNSEVSSPDHAIQPPPIQ